MVQRQRRAAEAAWLHRAAVALALEGARNVRGLADGAARGRTLLARELREVADTTRCAGRVQRALAQVRGDAPLLAAEGAAIPELDPLRRLIDSAVDPRGEVLDGASAELASIRAELWQAHDALLARMQSIASSPTLRPALSDSIVTQREGRYVVPVRSEARSALPGVVHDTSSSGRTVYVEPLAVVELGNRWRELQVQERREVERILRELSAAVGEAAAELVEAVERLAAIDLAVAAAALGRELGAGLPAEAGAEQPWLREAPAELRLVEARHPLLVWAGGEVVPVSLAIGGEHRDAEHRALLITGPNTGGKTVVLKSAGLLTLMALCGLPIPAERGSTVPVYDAVFADIGDEQSIEQSLSTFSSHVTAIIDVIERAGPRSLALLDELGAGTDPTEGAVLAVAIVEQLVAAGVTLIATTHHGELKLHAHRHPQLLNASVEFDMETLSPTYRLRMGLPGQSNALAIAERLGMPAAVVEAARAGISGEQRDLDRLLADLRAELASAEQRARAAEDDRAEAERLHSEVDARYDELEAETRRLREEAQRLVRSELRETERLLERTRRQVEAARLEQADADMDRAREAARAIPAPAPPPPPRPQRMRARREPIAVVPGARVWLAGVEAPGEALTAPDERGEFELALGALRTRARLAQVARTEAPGERAPGRVQLRAGPALDPGESIEVRGHTLDEALPTVEEYLDRAARAGRRRVLLIHGKGTGTLRRAVRELLASHPLVVSHEPAERAEGGEGVTVAHLAGVG